MAQSGLPVSAVSLPRSSSDYARDPSLDDIDRARDSPIHCILLLTTVPGFTITPLLYRGARIPYQGYLIPLQGTSILHPNTVTPVLKLHYLLGTAYREIQGPYHIFFYDTETTGLLSCAAPPAILDIALVDGATGIDMRHQHIYHSLYTYQHRSVG